MPARNEILAPSLLSKNIDSAQVRKLVIKYLKSKNQDEKAALRDDIFKDCIRFIRKTTLKIVDSNSDFLEDAFQTACVQFFIGLDKFDVKKDVSFLTYIYFWIIKGINDEFYSRGIINVKKDSYKGDRFKNLKNNSIIDIYKRATTSEGVGLELESKISDQKPGPETVLEQREMMQYLLKVADKNLSDIEKCIIKIRYFHDEQPNIKEIAEAMGISRQGVDQTEKRAFRKIKEAIRDASTRKRKSQGLRHKVELNENSEKIIYDKIMNKRVLREVPVKKKKKKKI